MTSCSINSCPFHKNRGFLLLLLQGTRRYSYTTLTAPAPPTPQVLIRRPSSYRLGGLPILPTSEGCTGSGDGVVGTKAMGMGMGTICVPSEEGAVDLGCASII